jgi:hypothetical protein
MDGDVKLCDECLRVLPPAKFEATQNGKTVSFDACWECRNRYVAKVVPREVVKRKPVQMSLRLPNGMPIRVPRGVARTSTSDEHLEWALEQSIRQAKGKKNGGGST